MWGLLLPQSELTLNLLRQATLDPSRYAWEYFHGPFNYEATPLGPIGCNIIAHKKTGTRNSWNLCGAAGWNVGVALQHYPCHTIVSKATRAAQVSDTVEFRYHNLTLPNVTPTDRIFYGVTTLIWVLQDSPTIACNNQLASIKALHQSIQQWSKPTQPVAKVATPPPTRTRQYSILCPMRRPTKDQPQDLLPWVVIQKPNASPSKRTVTSTKDNYLPIRNAHSPEFHIPWTRHIQG